MTHPSEVHLEKILKARKAIAPFVRETPLEASAFLCGPADGPVYLKLENWQKTGSFKIRGALNKMLALTGGEKGCGVITASAGNHALGVAYAAQLLNVQAKIVVPEKASPAKIQALKRYPIELLLKGRDYDEAEAIARGVGEQEGLLFVHAFDDPAVIAGQGTIGLEILEQLPAVQTILVPVGGGGLISGVAVAAKARNPHVRIIGVQSEASPAMLQALRAGSVVETPVAESVADGLAGRFVSERTLGLVQHFVDEVVLVSEAGIEQALTAALTQEHLLLEGSAVVGIAALLEKKVQVRGPTVVVLTGRNISVDLLQEIIGRSRWPS